MFTLSLKVNSVRDCTGCFTLELVMIFMARTYLQTGFAPELALCGHPYCDQHSADQDAQDGGHGDEPPDNGHPQRHHVVTVTQRAKLDQVHNQNHLCTSFSISRFDLAFQVR